MSFLKKVGVVIAKGTQVLTGVDFITPFLPAKQREQVEKYAPIVKDTLNDLAAVVVTAESIGVALNLSGRDKLSAVTPLAIQMVLQSALVANKPIEDPELFKQGVEKLVEGVVDILNSRSEKDIHH